MPPKNCEILFLVVTAIVFTSCGRETLEDRLITSHERTSPVTHAPTSEITITIDLTFNGEPISLDDLQHKLSAVGEKNSDTAVRLLTPKTINFSRIEGILDFCREAKIWNIAFEVQ